MALTLGRTRLRAHPLALLFPVAAAMLGAREDLAALMLGLAAHESAHLLAAKALGVGIDQLWLMPFGGAIRLENPYILSPMKLMAVAAAGPAGSLLALLCAAAFAHARLLSPALALALIRVNGLLLLFNLLPALPLDGGRMLYALLADRLGRDRAVALGIRAGRAVAGLLVAAAVWTALARRRLNLSFLFAAVFLLASAADERGALSHARIRALVGELKPISGPVPARVVAVGGSCSARAALRAARADAVTLYAVYENSRLTSFVDDRRLLEGILKSEASVRVGEVMSEAFHP